MTHAESVTPAHSPRAAPRAARLRHAFRLALTGAPRDGELQTPRTIQKAVDAAAAGDVVNIGAGSFHERVRVEKPLTLRGQSGAMLVVAEPFKAEWSKADGELDGVFTTYVSRESQRLAFIAPHWHFVNNLVLNKKGFGEPPAKADFTASHNATSARAAVDAGLDLSAYLDGKPLPGCPPGYFLGKAPDAGADESSLP